MEADERFFSIGTGRAHFSEAKNPTPDRLIHPYALPVDFTLKVANALAFLFATSKHWLPPLTSYSGPPQREVRNRVVARNDCAYS